MFFSNARFVLCIDNELNIQHIHINVFRIFKGWIKFNVFTCFIIDAVLTKQSNILENATHSQHFDIIGPEIWMLSWLSLTEEYAYDDFSPYWISIVQTESDLEKINEKNFLAWSLT